MVFNEEVFVSKLRKMVEETTPTKPSIPLGIGDDAALILPQPNNAIVISVDDQVENIHFRRRWCPPQNLAQRAVGAALSDLAAMGATPHSALSSIQISPDYSPEDLLSLSRTIIQTLAQHDCALIGGNVSKSKSHTSLSITVLGQCPRNKSLLRSNAHEGYKLWISDVLGRSQLAFQALEHQLQQPFPHFQSWIRRYLSPQPQIQLGRWVLDQMSPTRAIATMDISDGLLKDASRMAKASGVTLCLDTEALMFDDLKIAAKAFGQDPLKVALESGEEYELLIAAPPALSSALKNRGLRAIGHVRAKQESLVTNLQGQQLDHLYQGHDHLDETPDQASETF